jgi:hypothetical protein
MKHGAALPNRPLWARPAFSQLLSLLFFLTFLWSAAFHSWLAVAAPAWQEPNATLAIDLPRHNSSVPSGGLHPSPTENLAHA